MGVKSLCPFCHSRACAVEHRLETFVEYECRDCHKKWFAVEGMKPATKIPRFSLIPMLPECPHCHQPTRVRVERTVTREAVTDSYTCSLCGGTLRRDGGKVSA